MRGHLAISICIVTGRRDAVLDACLASLQAQAGAPPWELLVCAEGDPTVAGAVHARFPEARVCYVDHALPGAARNLLVERARGDLLLFLDDDVTVDVDLLDRLARLADAHPECDVFGGPNDTPAHSSRFQVVQGAVLASIVGSGPVRRRYGAHPAREADERWFILCNLAVRRRVMADFAHDLVCAEENGVLAELARDGVRMRYDPEMVAYHERRATLAGFCRQMHKYGRGRGQLLVRQPHTFRPTYLAPSALLAYVVSLPLLLPLLGPPAAAPAAGYAAAVGACSVWIARTLGRPLDLPLAAWLTVVLHACYGAGLVRGVVERRRPTPAPTAREWFGAVAGLHGPAVAVSAPEALATTRPAGDDHDAHRDRRLP